MNNIEVRRRLTDGGTSCSAPDYPPDGGLAPVVVRNIRGVHWPLPVVVVDMAFAPGRTSRPVDAVTEVS